VRLVRGRRRAAAGLRECAAQYTSFARRPTVAAIAGPIDGRDCAPHRRAERRIGHFDDSGRRVEFVNSRESTQLAAMGTSCPIISCAPRSRPSFVPFDPISKNLDTAVSSARQGIADYRAEYAAYYDRCQAYRQPGVADPNASSIGAASHDHFARDKATCAHAGEFYVNAIT